MLLYVIYFCFVRTTLRNCGICKHNSVRLFICMSVTLWICIWTRYCSYAIPVYVSNNVVKFRRSHIQYANYTQGLVRNFRPLSRCEALMASRRPTRSMQRWYFRSLWVIFKSFSYFEGNISCRTATLGVQGLTITPPGHTWIGLTIDSASGRSGWVVKSWPITHVHPCCNIKSLLQTTIMNWSVDCRRQWPWVAFNSISSTANFSNSKQQNGGINNNNN